MLQAHYGSDRRGSLFAAGRASSVVAGRIQAMVSGIGHRVPFASFDLQRAHTCELPYDSVDAALAITGSNQRPAIRKNSP